MPRTWLTNADYIAQVEAERDRLEDELRQERLRKWSTGGAMTTEEANALRQENGRYRAALEEIGRVNVEHPAPLHPSAIIARAALEGEE